MGDRTFTADDVLRIYEFYLDEDEMAEVELFFQPELDINEVALTRVLNAMLFAIQLLTTPAIGLLISVFPAAVSSAYNEAVSELFRGTRAIDNAIGSINA